MPPSRRQLEDLIAELDGDETRLLKSLEDVRALRAKLVEALELSTRSTLTAALTPVKVNVNTVTNEHRLNIAKGQKPGDLEFAAVLAAKNLTQKKLAAKLNITPALLSMYRKNKRPIPRERAAKVEELTGWKATLSNWPGGIVS